MLSKRAANVLDDLARTSIERYQVEQMLSSITDPAEHEKLHRKFEALSKTVYDLGVEWDAVKHETE